MSASDALPVTLRRTTRRQWLEGVSASALLAHLPAGAQNRPACDPISDWSDFVTRHVQRDGRVVDFDTPQQHSTSEGQSYSLFFALVHNDRTTFARVLAWTQNNLCSGSLAARLPAWQWGLKPDGSWGVLDVHPASDADLWIAYCLLEAGRLWREPRYGALGRAVLSRVAREEVLSLEGLGAIVLPWPASLARPPVYRLNPSYLPVQLLRRFAQEDVQGPWSEIADNTVRLLGAVSPHGFVPDWCAWSGERKTFVTDPEKGTTGSYDAIRAYLWAGMLDVQEPARAELLSALFGPRHLLEQPQAELPELVDTATGLGRGRANVGFAAALLPYLRAQGSTSALAVQSARVKARATVPPAGSAPPLPYYERMLILFGQGWLDGRYAFDRKGHLQPHWSSPCHSTRMP